MKRCCSSDIRLVVNGGAEELVGKPEGNSPLGRPSLSFRLSHQLPICIPLLPHSLQEQQRFIHEIIFIYRWVYTHYNVCPFYIIFGRK
jgi:hypothetical protein